MSVAYRCDGSLEGILSAVFAAYARRETPSDILSSESTQLRLDQQLIDVDTDFEQASRVARSIKRQFGPQVWRRISLAAASDTEKAGTVVYRFIRMAFESGYSMGCSQCPSKAFCETPCKTVRGGELIEDLSRTEVGDLVDLARSVSNECEKMRQFIRFRHTREGFWYARCNPSASVVPFVMSWFSSRFNTQDFAIYDETHGLVGLSSGGSWRLVRSDAPAQPRDSPEELRMQHAWRCFYAALSIEERYNPELRRSLMPKRLWRNLTEMQEDLPLRAPGTHSETFMQDL